jgi:hypothetical protein
MLFLQNVALRRFLMICRFCAACFVERHDTRAARGHKYLLKYLCLGGLWHAQWVI